MAALKIYHHDPVEVSPKTSWTGLSDQLARAEMEDIRTCTSPAVLSLFEYARPDAVVCIDEAPVVAIEQTMMNPSGHNIPQRFSCLVRAAELGVPGILYYPRFSRRTFSDPNVRYLQVRVPLAQLRLTSIYETPSLSVFWPTDVKTKLPATAREAHAEMAGIVDALIEAKRSGSDARGIPLVTAAVETMREAVAEKMDNQRVSATVRALLPDGYETVRALGFVSVDPPTKAMLLRTEHFLDQLERDFAARADWGAARKRLLARPLTLLFTGTTNKSGNDSEHPWPGYLTLLDVLYARSNGGRSPTHRDQNLVYSLPTAAEAFLRRLEKEPRPTATHIVDTFADLLVLRGGVVPGRPLRGNAAPSLILRA